LRLAAFSLDEHTGRELDLSTAELGTSGGQVRLHTKIRNDDEIAGLQKRVRVEELLDAVAVPVEVAASIRIIFDAGEQSVRKRIRVTAIGVCRKPRRT
jgi:hypothetical protein